MKKAALALVFLWVGLGMSCGRKGPILPPVKKIPQPVKNLSCVQTGDTLRLKWESPDAYLNGAPLDAGAYIEIYMASFSPEREDHRDQSAGGEAAAAAGQPGQSAAGSTQPTDFDFEKDSYLLAIVRGSRIPENKDMESTPKPPEWFDFLLEKPEYFSRTLVFAVRVVDGRKKKSAFSDTFPFSPKSVSLPPVDLNYFIREDRITIMWGPPPANIDETTPPAVKAYNVFRAEDDGQYRKLNDKPVIETRFEDKDFVFGNSYFYGIKALPDPASSSYESAFSDAVEVLAKDTFPPAAPKGIHAIPGGGMISLSWEIGSERDLAGYRVWRRKAGEKEFQLVTSSPIKENAFNDTRVESGTRYEYVITAVDQNGNESGRSPSIEESIR